MGHIELKDILLDGKYKLLSETRLGDVINFRISLRDYDSLEGYDSRDKARNLIKLWKKDG